MDDQLKKLREAMDHTVFKEAQFNSNQKERIQGKIRKKKSFHFAPTAVFTAFIMTIVAVSLIYMQQERSANYRALDNDLEGINFVDMYTNNNSFSFNESQLLIHSDSMLERISSTIEPQIKEVPEYSYEYSVYDNITVKTTGNQYTIYSHNELLMTLEKIAPRIVQDSEGNEYWSHFYLSKSYEINFINESIVNIFAIELMAEGVIYRSADDSGKPLAKGQSMTFEIPRDSDTVHQTARFDIAIDYLDSQGKQQRVQLKDQFVLDNSYSDFYEVDITGDSYDTLVLSLKEEAVE